MSRKTPVSQRLHDSLLRPLPVNSFQDKCRLANRIFDDGELRWARPVRVHVHQLPGAEQRCGKKDCVLSFFGHRIPRTLDLRVEVECKETIERWRTRPAKSKSINNRSASTSRFPVGRSLRFDK